MVGEVPCTYLSCLAPDELVCARLLRLLRSLLGTFLAHLFTQFSQLLLFLLLREWFDLEHFISIQPAEEKKRQTHFFGGFLELIVSALFGMKVGERRVLEYLAAL